MLNISTYLTISRLILIPFFVFTFYLHFYLSPLITGIIFIIGAVTDLFDGFFARYLKQTTKFGSFLDPIADKIMIAVGLILVTEYFHTCLVTLPVIIIVMREFIISALREWMSKIGKSNITIVSFSAKLKTVTQMLSLFFLLWKPNILVIKLGIIILYIAAILSVWSMLSYLRSSYKSFFKKF